MTTKGIVGIVSTLMALGGIGGFLWTAGPIIADLRDLYEIRNQIKESVNLRDEIIDLHNSTLYQKAQIDTLKAKIWLLEQGKYPADSVVIETRNGVRTLPLTTDWLIRRSLLNTK